MFRYRGKTGASQASVRRVVHLIPYDGIGGVESAARQMRDVDEPGIDFQVESIFPKQPGGRQGIRKQISGILHAVRGFYKAPPDLLILSLWRCAIVGILLKAIKPRLKLVLFLHYPDDVHYFDFITTRVTAVLAFRIWADSDETKRQRLSHCFKKKTRTISFLTARLDPVASKNSPSPHFVFWGRLHLQKRLDLALILFQRIKQAIGPATFSIIGPDGGERDRLHELIMRAGMQDSVRLHGPMKFSEIMEHAKHASFYLQTSAQEGMAISVVEAMQLGLVPVVTPVGEIRNYCEHMQNSILVSERGNIVDDVERVIGDTALYHSIQEKAVHTWVHKPLYRDSVIVAVKEALEPEQ